MFTTGARCDGGRWTTSTSPYGVEDFRAVFHLRGRCIPRHRRHAGVHYAICAQSTFGAQEVDGRNVS